MALKRASPSAPSVFVGVDVGTGSARAAAFDLAGRLLGEASKEIQRRTPCAEHCEQSSEDIWQACCVAVRGALAACGNPEVAGLAFDATCSLVVLGEGDVPLAVGADLPDAAAAAACGERAQVFNVIMWCDHRAAAEAEAINASGHRLLRNVGGRVSPEMELPKLAWLKRHRPTTYRAARRFFDLADYLTYRAAGGCATHGEGAGLRSMCTVVCKWNFDAEAMDWDASFLAAAGLTDLGEQRIGRSEDVREVGARVPGGVCAAAARELGLSPGAALGVGIIDAHAGGLGCLGGEPPPHWGLPPRPLPARMALIAGTSTCHMASSSRPVFVPGVWGPYASAMVPSLFLSEGGQSTAGAALDFLVETHAAFPALAAAAAAAGRRPTELLNARLRELAAERGAADPALLTAGLHVGADLSGCRSPLADPQLRGSVIGLGPPGPVEQATGIDALAVLYLAAVQALAYSTRSIVAAINDARAAASDDAAGPIEPISAVFACGGLASNDVFVQAHADALGLPVLLPEVPGAAMPLGSAMLAAAASGAYATVADAMRCMGALDRVVKPTEDPAVRRFHDARYEISVRMQRHQQEYRSLERAALQRP